MFITKPINATLVQYNRGTSGYYDDQDTQETNIRLVPYNEQLAIRFGTYTVPEATGYFIVDNIDIQIGDQIEFQDMTYTILRVDDLWQFNKVTNKVVAVK